MFSTNKEDEKERFVKNLFGFLQLRGVANLKIPQIGGKELDLYELYQSVIRKGGAQKVSNCKMWKDIVAEFDLPPSCTSASFTLKNHYQKYLLAYEQKFFFGKSEDEMVRELGNVRQRRPHNDINRGIDTRSEIPRERPIQSDNFLRQNLTSFYDERKKTSEYVTFIKRVSMVPFGGEMKRVMLAFESKLQEEVRFALNCLLLYSCSSNTPFYIETAYAVFEGMVNYLEGMISSVPEIFKISFEKMQASGANNPLGDLGDIIPGQKSSPIEQMKNDRMNMITMKYDEISKSEAIEQIRIIFQIIRNLICIPQNEPLIFKHKRVNDIVLETFFTCVDPEINRSVLEIVSILCKHILISSIPNRNSSLFCSKIVDYLSSETHEEFESALECFHNLMLSQENEIIIEGMLPEIVEYIVKMLFSTSYETIESSLEILCYLSDLKISTRLFLAKKNNLIPRLLAIIAGNVSKNNEKIPKLAALILSNLSVAPSAKQYFLPFERDIFSLATIDDTVSDQLSGILLELESADNDLLQISTDFYTQKMQALQQA